MMMKTAQIIVHAASEFMKLKYELLCCTHTHTRCPLQHLFHSISKLAGQS